MKMKTNYVKSFLLVGLCTLFFYTSSAQLTITNDGNVGVGVDNPISKFAVNDSGAANVSLYVRNRNVTDCSFGIKSTVNIPDPASTSNAFTAIQGIISCGNGGTKGVFGQSFRGSALSSGKAFGVYGNAGNATSGYNYGLYGLLSGSNNGAAVYGVTGTSNLEENTAGIFAGYFKGRVYVSNYLSVGNKNSSYPVDVTGTVRATSFFNFIRRTTERKYCIN
jgi:hypothetical protein